MQVDTFLSCLYGSELTSREIAEITGISKLPVRQ